jgi:methyltransferase
VSLLPAVVALVALQRLAELALAAHHTRRLLARGAVEHGRGHYPLFPLLHGFWLAALLLAVPWDRPPDWWLLGAYLALQPLRVWVIASLGGRWTTRVIVPPGEPPLRRGPYRLVRHPNYAIVALEIPLLPAAFGAWDIAALFGCANLVLLAWRIRIEDRALHGRAAAATV